MTYRPRAACKRCGMTRQAAGHLSRAGNCGPCGVQALADNLRQLAAKSGPYWDRYRMAMVDYAASLWGGTAPPESPRDIPGMDAVTAELLHISRR